MHDGMNHATMNHSAPMPSLALVPVEQATHVVVASGNWSDPATWSEGQVPGEGAHVLIPEGLSVTVDAVLMPEIKTIRADGVLDFATDVNTELRVDTLVTTETGTLRIGTANAPIDATVTARVIFADDGPIDRDWDPGLISRGALLHGRTEIFGAEKTAFTVLAEQPTAGATSLTLSTVPSGWRVGDTLSVAGTDPADPASDEIVTITAIDGATITLNRPLERDHVAPAADLDVHVANLTRNVEFTSENEGALNRGHVMFMHTNDADVRHVGFQGLGRTDKSQELTDWTLDVGNEEALTPELTEVIELGGTNVRGRYSVHFHRGGDEGPPAHVEGAVVRDDPGWAYVNHSSNVDFIGNVSHNITGAAYNTEAGDEVGSFVGNIALRTVNPGANLNPAGAELDPEQAPDARLGSQDYGWQGDGFWFHGSGVTVDDNVVSGASGHAYIYWQLGLVERGLGENMVDVANLPNGDLIGPAGTMVRTKQVPVVSFDGNEAYSASKGLQIHYLHTDNRDDADAFFVQEGLLTEVPQAYEDTLQSTFSDATFWNVRLSGIDAPYASRLTFEDIELIGAGEEGSVGLKLDHFANQNNFTVRDVDIEGFEVGIGAPRQGLGLIEDAELATPIGIRIAFPDSDPRALDIRNITFVEPSDPTFGDERADIVLDGTFDFDFGGGAFDGDEDEDFEDFEHDDFEDDAFEDEDEEDFDEDDDDGEYGDEKEDLLNVAFVGDSITDAEPEESFVTYLDEALGDGVEAQSFALGGSGLTDAVGEPLPDTEIYEELLDSDAEVIWIMIGGNDLDGGASVEDYAEALSFVIGDIQEMPSDPTIVVAAQPPFSEFLPEGHEVFRDEWLPAMEEVAEESGALFFDLNAIVPDYPDNYPDLVHPDAAGAQTLADLIQPVVERVLPDVPFSSEDDDEDDDSDEDAFDDEEGDLEDDDFEDDDFAGDEEDGEDDDEDEEFERPEGTPAPFLPDRIVFDRPGDAPVGLFFEQQAADYVPVPGGSELAKFLPASIVGLTNAQLQAQFGISVGDTVTPDGAATVDGILGGLVGPARPAFEPFPPAPEPFFAQGQDDDDGSEDEDEDQPVQDDDPIEEPEDDDVADPEEDDPEDADLDEDEDEDEDDEIPEDDAEDDVDVEPDDEDADEAADADNTETDGDDDVASDEDDTPVDEAMNPAVLAKLYIVVYGRMPDVDGFAFWSGVMADDAGFGLVRLATAFAEAAEFEALFGGASAGEIVTGLYQNVLARDPDAAGLAHWSAALEGSEGFGLVDLALSFALAEETDAIYGADIDGFLAGRMGEADALSDDAVQIGTPEADVFLFPPSDGFAIVEAFDPALDRIDLSEAPDGTPEVIGVDEGVIVVVGTAELFLDDVDPEQIGEQSFLF